jgi:hypothetical protein
MKTSLLKFLSLALFFAAFVFTSCEEDITDPDIVVIDDVFAPPPTANQQIETAVLVEDYQNLFELKKRDGYRPVWIDGFQHRAGVSTDSYNTTMFNVIFEKATEGQAWQAFHGLTGASYQAKFNELTADGYRLEFIESYVDNGAARYAPIFVKKSGPAYVATHGKPIANWQAYFNDKVADGYRLVNRSVIMVNGNKYVTALFDKKDVGSWVSKSNLTPGQTQTEMENNKQLGRPLSHMDISQTNLTDDYTFGVIFNSEDHNNWYALNQLDQTELDAEIAEAKSNGYTVTLVCAYDKFALINGNEVHQIRYAVGFRK